MLTGNAIGGPLPTAIANITSLLALRVSANSFTSTLPEEYFQMSQLRLLNLVRLLLQLLLARDPMTWRETRAMPHAHTSVAGLCVHVQAYIAALLAQRTNVTKTGRRLAIANILSCMIAYLLIACSECQPVDWNHTKYVSAG